MSAATRLPVKRPIVRAFPVMFLANLGVTSAKPFCVSFSYSIDMSPQVTGRENAENCWSVFVIAAIEDRCILQVWSQ